MLACYSRALSKQFDDIDFRDISWTKLLQIKVNLENSDHIVEEVCAVEDACLIDQMFKWCYFVKRHLAIDSSELDGVFID